LLSGRRSQIDEDVLIKIDAAVERYHIERKIFVDCGIRNDFNLPRQHALLHYRTLIQMFGAPNGLLLVNYRIKSTSGCQTTLASI